MSVEVSGSLTLSGEIWHSGFTAQLKPQKIGPAVKLLYPRWTEEISIPRALAFICYAETISWLKPVKSWWWLGQCALNLVNEVLAVAHPFPSPSALRLVKWVNERTYSLDVPEVGCMNSRRIKGAGDTQIAEVNDSNFFLTCTTGVILRARAHALTLSAYPGDISAPAIWTDDFQCADAGIRVSTLGLRASSAHPFVLTKTNGARFKSVTCSPPKSISAPLPPEENSYPPASANFMKIECLVLIARCAFGESCRGSAESVPTAHTDAVAFKIHLRRKQHLGRKQTPLPSQHSKYWHSKLRGACTYSSGNEKGNEPGSSSSCRMLPNLNTALAWVDNAAVGWSFHFLRIAQLAFSMVERFLGSEWESMNPVGRISPSFHVVWFLFESVLARNPDFIFQKFSWNLLAIAQFFQSIMFDPK
ncbi:hypothetical protein C8F04DRAFT_1232778 [Mycena alexandri]|uniref:Uncharacterized protein n=1 Tax=Mycena alexandri TaxID=1745969 RepID=A0AAD6T1K4_9AGAR|nr:hypothetical protein C8F04DRAFT_1232778 [Mycena alexandri]